MAEEHKLNTEYTGQTRLREWWPIVRSNFESLLGWFNAHIAGKADRHTATDIDYASGKTVKAKIDEETEAREKADGTISNLVSPDGGAKPTNLTDAINREIAKRQDEDIDLSGKIDDEKNDREEADNKLKELLGNFDELRHLGLTWDNLAGAIADVYTELGEVEADVEQMPQLFPVQIVEPAEFNPRDPTTRITFFYDKNEPEDYSEFPEKPLVVFSRYQPDGAKEEIHHSLICVNWTFYAKRATKTITPQGQDAWVTTIWNEQPVTTDKISGSAVTHAKLAENSVWEKNLGSQAVTNDKIANDAVTFNKIQDGAIITTKLYDGAVTNEKIAGDSISHDKLKSNSVWENHLGVDAVTAEKIASGAVTTSKLSNGAVTLNKLSSTLYTYSKKPVRVGTWVDGTPVWRAAIPITTLSAAGITRTKNLINVNINVNSLLERLGIIKTTTMIYIDSMLRLQNDSTDYDFACSPTDGITESDVPGIYTITWCSGDNARTIYGWCEFATDESNIA